MLRDIAVPDGQHICLMYNDDEERFRVLAGFFRAALARRQRARYVTDDADVAAVRARFRARGVELDVWQSQQLYYPVGRFVPEEVIAQIEGFVEEAIAQGFDGGRASGEMAWALRGIPGAERLLDYERMLTDLIARIPLSGICQYDVRRFDGRTLLAVLEVHPYMLVRGQVLRNPNFRRGAPSPERWISSPTS